MQATQPGTGDASRAILRPILWRAVKSRRNVRKGVGSIEKLGLRDVLIPRETWLLR